jgi:tRNA U55 pseudouridine synthase TruB
MDLAADLARSLDTRGHMTSLVRTKQGPFGLDLCLPREEWQFETLLAHLATCNAHIQQQQQRQQP